jgi:hypothetical protein
LLKVALNTMTLTPAWKLLVLSVFPIKNVKVR